MIYVVKVFWQIGNAIRLTYMTADIKKGEIRKELKADVLYLIFCNQVHGCQCCRVFLFLRPHSHSHSAWPMINPSEAKNTDREGFVRRLNTDYCWFSVSHHSK